jgi:ubiquinone/menaquinone biosynthesis C-methylase UbiE
VLGYRGALTQLQPEARIYTMEELVFMKTQILTKHSEVEAAWSKQYERLAQIFDNALGKKDGLIAEIGCGSRQLTIPLAQLATSAQFVLVDRFANMIHGAYSHNYKALVSNLRKAKLMRRARIVVSDYLKWLSRQDDATYGAVVSSEFLPEIDSGETRLFMQECYRVLKPRGAAAHSFLSPTARNPRQKLLIEPDSNPVWTQTPPKEWFSPKPELVTRELKESGFKRIRRITIRSHLIMKADTAKSLLTSTKASFYETQKKQLSKSGLEIPDWIIVSGIRP